MKSLDVGEGIKRVALVGHAVMGDVFAILQDPGERPLHLCLISQPMISHTDFPT